MEHYDIIIVGAGLAGLTAAIHLAGKNHSILVFEKKVFPHHKVCGEYVSNEVRPYLEFLGVEIPKTSVDINTLTVSSVDGRSITTRLPLGGFGISRYTLDRLLYEKAKALGVSFVFQTVSKITFLDPGFRTTTSGGEEFNASFVIGAFGKRSILDKELKREFITRNSPWLGVKSHYRLDSFPDNLVGLHNFRGGYGGLSKTETGAINFCYLVNYQSFQEENNVDAFNTKVIRKNPFLNTFLKDAEPIFDEPLTIAQISFGQKKAVENHMLMCGDSAGLIHPLCGNGMAMAIHSAKIAAELLHSYLKENGRQRGNLEKAYADQWNDTFSKRLWIGRWLQALLLKEKFSSIALSMIIKTPWLLNRLILSTHGKPIL